MQDKAVYHASAEEYNRKAAVFFDELADQIEDPTVRKWCIAICKQHKYHQQRHERALSKVQLGSSEAVETYVEAVTSSEKSIMDQQAEWAAEQLEAETTEAEKNEPQIIEDARLMSVSLTADGPGEIISVGPATVEPDVCPEEPYHDDNGTGLFDERGHHITKERYNQLHGITEA